MLNDLDTKLTAQPLKDEDDQKPARQFINTFNALLGLLDKPDTRRPSPSCEGQGYVDRQPPRLHARLQPAASAPATTLKERQAYQQLCETLDQTRDQILSEAKIDLKKPLSAQSGGRDRLLRPDQAQGRHRRTLPSERYLSGSMTIRGQR